MTAGVIALSMSAAACGASKTETICTPHQVAEVPAPVEAHVTAGPAERQTFQLVSGEFAASDLIGASVHNAAGEEIANIADIRLAEDGEGPMIILRDGGVAGALHTVGFQDATIVPDPDTTGDEPNLMVQFSGQTLKTLPVFEQPEADDYSLASEMMGTNATITSSGETARIRDIVLTNKGEARFAVISPDVLNPEQIVVYANSILVSDGGYGWRADAGLDGAGSCSRPRVPPE
jgi:hypothetical protein